MDVFEALRRRRVHRTFDTRQVPRDVVSKLLFAGGKAPTGANLPYRGFIVVDKKDTIVAIKKISPGFPGISPLVIVIFSNTRLAREEGGNVGEFGTIFDAGVATGNILLACVAEGLVACLVKSYPEAGVAQLLRLPEGIRTEIMIAIGYPNGKPSRSVKKRLGADVAFHNRFNSKYVV